MSSLSEARRRAEQLIRKAVGSKLDLSKVLFAPQLTFARDEATFSTSVCSRRAGKSVGLSGWLLEGPIENPAAPSLYFTLTRGSAKRIMWNTMLEMNRKYDLGYEPNEQDLILKRRGRGAVYLTGVDNRGEIEKIRGTGWGRVAGDEAQVLPEYTTDLVEDVLMPSFMDHGGQLKLAGTPGSVPAGFFYEVSTGKHAHKWTHHHWTVWDNPFISDANKQKALKEALSTRGVTIDHPSIRREFFGEWAYDPDALVFKLNPAINFYDQLPMMVEKWQHVIGVDLGYDDADAIAVLAFQRDHPAAFLRHEDVMPKQSISALAVKLQGLVEEYKPLAVVVDTGGLGKKIAEEIGSRTGLPLQPAEKTRKFEFIELVNDALRTGRLFVRSDSRFASDALKLEWDRDKCIGEKLVISSKFHSDIADAVLYCFRESLHWLHKDVIPKPAYGSPEWNERAKNIMFEAAQKAVRQDKSRTEIEDFGGEMDSFGSGWEDF